MTVPAAKLRRPAASSRTAGGLAGDGLTAGGPAAGGPAADTVQASILPACTPPGNPAAGAQWQELLRALAAVALSPPPQCAPAAASLGLPVPDGAEHTGVFVLSAPPHAAIHLGEEGKLGGEGMDRVAGFWRVLGLSPPSDADHLGALLMLAAELGDAVASARSERAGAALARARAALIWEHLWSWAPGYLSAVARLGAPVLSPWARLTLAALAREAGPTVTGPTVTGPTVLPAELPLALRSAPPALRAGGTEGVSAASVVSASGRDDLLDALLAPVRSGIVLTREDLRAAAESVGVGYRVGERRYALAAMFDQDADRVLGWLSRFAGQWESWHLEQPPAGGPDPRLWWADRAASTSLALRELRRELAAAG